MWLRESRSWNHFVLSPHKTKQVIVTNHSLERLDYEPVYTDSKWIMLHLML